MIWSLTPRLGLACKYILCSRTRVELGGDVCDYKVRKCASQREVIILLGKQFF